MTASLVAACCGAGLLRAGALPDLPFLEDYRTGLLPNEVDHVMEAFAAASAQLQSGKVDGVQFRPGRRYLVGRQKAYGAHFVDPAGRSTAMAFAPDPILRVSGSSKPITIRGNGASLKAASGLRFGGFDRHGPMPFDSEPMTQAWPYVAMLEFLRCESHVDISDLELDGSCDQMVLGGSNGADGRQLPGMGIFLSDHRGTFSVSNVHAHHHPLDGIQTDLANRTGTGDRPAGRLDRVRADSNCRQGWSAIGGRSVVATACRFERTGRARWSSSPAAGVDIEAQTGPNRDYSFIDCVFSDNVGSGFIADSGDSRDIRFDRCTFVGTTNYAAWLNKPGIRARDCIFVGSVVRPFPATNPADALLMERCVITDNPSLSPSGTVFGAGGEGYLLTIPTDLVARFDNLRIVSVANSQAIYSPGGKAQFLNLTIESSRPLLLHGTFYGVSRITARGGSIVPRLSGGTVNLNGRRLPGV